MSNGIKATSIVAAVVVVAGALFFVRLGASSSLMASPPMDLAAQARVLAELEADSTAAHLPRLVELGSADCPYCRMLAPVLEELKREYAGQLQVNSIDVDNNAAAKSAFAVHAVPTLLFVDTSGNVLWRHEGFLPKEDILAKLKEFNIELPPAKAA